MVEYQQRRAPRASSRLVVEAEQAARQRVCRDRKDHHTGSARQAGRTGRVAAPPGHAAKRTGPRVVSPARRIRDGFRSRQHRFEVEASLLTTSRSHSDRFHDPSWFPSRPSVDSTSAISGPSLSRLLDCSEYRTMRLSPRIHPFTLD